ncbi:hypothetical protein GDO81_014450 [Engystomops pustulosus]|uniref:E3 ubiquitin-protein ligase RNF26 n=1 Tax=Engystomops pustulosus TaxID=76066 RepID=A0AAV7BAL9_ENGPU|nr:hypothetical protein GDO81_014450 [Engystomops pustulosus]
MQGILLVISGLGWLLDLLLLVLDLNYWLVSSIVSLLLWTIRFTLNLPGTILLGLFHCWQHALVSLAVLGETGTNLALSSVHALGDGVRGLLSGLDSLQLLWNLMCHMLLRTKEMMQRGILSIALSGQNFQRQVWEALGIASGLVAYIVNSLVNMCLIGVQNIFSAALGLWLTIINVIFVGKDLIIALLSQISSSAVAVVILFWTPFQLAVDLLVYCSTGIGVILFRHFYEVLLLLFLIWVSRLILRPPPALLSFQERLRRHTPLVRILIHNILSAEIWRRAAFWFRQLVRMYRAAWDRDRNLMRTRAQDRQAGRRVVRVPATRAQNPAPAQIQHQSVAARPPIPQIARPVPLPYASTSQETETVTAEDPWKLLKQQEESKKCVICQDENKSVLLLPCRHLCLCSQCTEILLQQPILQRNCPLCRKMILQTLTVYM